MSGTSLRYQGTTSAMSPLIKRGVATLTDGRVATLSIDSNLASMAGVDVTGVAKICVYLSTDASRTAHALAINYTPAVAPSSSTRYAVASMTSSANDTLYIVYQGVDNGLYILKWTYSAGVFTFVNVQTIQAAGGITNRFRCLDIDVAGNDRPVVICYEAKDSAGNGADVKIRSLRTDNTTWDLVATIATLSVGQFIKTNSEDVSIAWRGDGIVSNVGRVLVYCTQTAVSIDKGDIVREYSMNVSTGAAATTIGTWFTTLNAKNAAGSRRAMIFTLSTTLWLLAGVYGTSTPRFFATKLTTGNSAPPSITYAGYISSIALSSLFKIDATRFTIQLWSATYRDNRLSFGFVAPGTAAGKRVFREIIFTYASLTAASGVPSLDQVPRPLDGEMPQDTWEALTISGGDNKRLSSGLKSFNYNVTYVQTNTGSYATNVTNRVFVAEDTFNPPVLISPIDATYLTNGVAEATNRPVFRVRVDNVNLTPNLYGKIQVQVATDNAFTMDLKTITQPDSALQYFGNKDGLTGAGKTVSVQATTNPESLFTGQWFWRARIVSDKDTPGEWSDDSVFDVLHPPVAKQVSPAKGIIVAPVNGYRDNMISNGDAGNGSVTPQTGYNGTLTYSTVQSHTAPGSFRLVPTGGFADAQVLSPMFTCKPGDQFTVKGWIRPDTANKSTRIQVNYYDASNAYLGGTGTTTAPSAGNWTEITATSSSVGLGSTVAKVQLAIGLTGTPAVGDAFYVDDLDMVQSSGEVVFSWTSSDTEPSDVQSEYNLNVVRTDTGASILSTGWVVSNLKSVTKTFTYDQYELPLAWDIQLKDVDGTAGLVAGPSDFTVGHSPAVAIVTPAFDTTVTTATPTITWSYFSAGGRTQKAYRITVTDFNTGLLVADTLWRMGAETSYTFPTNVMENSGEYDLQVMVFDTAGLYDEAYGHVYTDWVEPALGDLTLTKDSYKVHLAWTDANKDSEFVSWRIYRRYMVPASVQLDVDNTATTWVLIHETAEDLASYSYDDYTCPLNKPVDYVIVQVADRFGSIIESNITAFTTTTMAGDKYYFVPEVPVGTIASYESNSVTGDNFTKEIEQETLHVIGRGRQVQVGDDLGYSGTLTLKFRNPTTARINREFLEALSAESNSVYIKSPFGDVVLVSIGNIQTNRQAGFGGGADIVDVSVPYLQVIAPAQITRSV